MTKQEIVDIVSDATGLTKVETETIMNGVMMTIIDSLARNEKVELRGFGRFSTKIQKQSIRRNPKTNQKVSVSSKRVIRWRMSKELFRKLNNDEK